MSRILIAAVLVPDRDPDVYEAESASISDDELVAGLSARLCAFYADVDVDGGKVNDEILPAAVRVVPLTVDAATTLFGAAGVGLDGDVPEPYAATADAATADAAFTALHHLSTVTDAVA